MFSLSITGQEVDSTQLAIKDYFENSSSILSKYFEQEIILDIKDESYFSSFDEFDLFFVNVVLPYEVKNWEFSSGKQSYFVVGKSNQYVIFFEFEKSKSGKIDTIFIGKRKENK